ncbi:nodulation protein NfeD [Oceanobacillus piezotolerans]|uniref:Nodulation protein NfeD n=1 Tax=Oceanobacillus piezotolerans TaxID=2448030 RepID=A0A498DAM9_9BACI|nr:nodulation protein NfeD [Oceanobacillus piezotolerans]RLL48041.1 nodulation protein NfeD [Oceanobacillus piezotolerans]
MLVSKRLPLYIVLISLMVFAVIAILTDVSTIAEAEEGEGELVYIIPVEKEVERGLEAFLKRTTNEAIENGADHIVLEIDTPGGRVDSAGQIGTLLQNLELPTTSFIVNEALSAGSYIALNTDNIYFVPHATMGASGVINSDGTAADKKAQSAWIERMSAAAESNGRDPLYAVAMADPSIDLSEYGAPEGEFLTLGPQDAVEVGYAEGIVNDRVELLHELNLSRATVVETQPTLAEEVARFLTNPVVYSILLSIASLGLIVELYSPGFGVPGTMGLISLVLFFYGHIVAGLAGWEAIILLVVGIILIIAEFFVPGGILGFLGVAATVCSLLMSGYDIGQMAMSVGIAFLVAIVASVILFRRVGLDKGVFRHIILKDSTTTEEGYVSSINRLELIGLEGEAITSLRPSGIGEFDHERIDVVSEGAYIEKGTRLKVVKVEGHRVVVKRL